MEWGSARYIRIGPEMVKDSVVFQPQMKIIYFWMSFMLKMKRYWWFCVYEDNYTVVGVLFPLYNTLSFFKDVFFFCSVIQCFHGFSWLVLGNSSSIHLALLPSPYLANYHRNLPVAGVSSISQSGTSIIGLSCSIQFTPFLLYPSPLLLISSWPDPA